MSANVAICTRVHVAKRLYGRYATRHAEGETALLHGNEITKVTAMTQLQERKKDLRTLSGATDQLNLILR